MEPDGREGDQDCGARCQREDLFLTAGNQLNIRKKRGVNRPTATDRNQQALFQLRVNFLNCVLQCREIIYNDLPYQVGIYLKIFMDQNVSHTDNLFPFYVGE
jgi:hypothetical protein